MAMSKFDQKFGNSSVCSCAVKIWPKMLINTNRYQNIRIMVAECKEGCGSVEFVGW